MSFLVRDVYAWLFPGTERVAASDDTLSPAESDVRLWIEAPSLDDPDGAALKRVRGKLDGHVQAQLGRWAEQERARRRVPSASNGDAGVAWPATLDPVRHLPPRRPYDVFMIAAYLIEAGGVYQHIQPEKHGRDSGCDRPGHDIDINHPRHLAISAADLAVVSVAAKAWRAIPVELAWTGAEDRLVDHLMSADVWRDIEPLFESWLWVFGMHASSEVFRPLPADPATAPAAPAWWFHAWRLLAIADEAARHTGFNVDTEALQAPDRSTLPWFELQVFTEFVAANFRSEEEEHVRPTFGNAEIGFKSLAGGRREVACVLPKVRTPSIGCTLRSLSHHLALLPPSGVARGKWQPSFLAPSKQAALPNGQMNLLLVPFPYSIGARAFCGSITERAGAGAKAKYGYFDVHQDWLASETHAEDLVGFVHALITAAKAEAGRVNGVVFPELSLNHRTYGALRDHLARHVPEIEVFVAGTSSKSEGRQGNYVAVTSFFDSFKPGGPRSPRQIVREKHHRWKLDAPQLRDYGLQGVLSPELDWWENIDLLSRRVDFTVLRENSVLAALICEDLARVDPCQLILRAAAPNLVVALLMDAPQATVRWPARYATVLAEDPGCAVLTLTSRALMTRQHRLGVFRSQGEDRYIAMWREDGASAPRSIHCPYDAQAVLFSMVETNALDTSLDGRVDQAKAWRYAGHIPVRIPDAKEKYPHILGEDDLACW